MYPNQYRTYFIQNGQWTAGYHNWATGMGSLMYRGRYDKAFKKAPPVWLYHFELLNRIHLMRKAIDDGNPLPEYHGVLTWPAEFPEGMSHDYQVRFKSHLGFWNYSGDN